MRLWLSTSIALEEAIAELEALLDIVGLNERIAATCKLTLGDIYVFQGMIWDASLVYSQVVLDFKDDPIGHDAKFRNARVSYYGGDFAWAQSQLDALKASTSKLISNDAIDLSLSHHRQFQLGHVDVADGDVCKGRFASDAASV